MPENKEIIETVQDFCRERVFEKKLNGKRSWDDYKHSWLQHTKEKKGVVLQHEQLSAFTTQEIQEVVIRKYGTHSVDKERRVGGESELAFDLWNRTEGTAFEICLGAIKNEFEKDVLKGILDTDTIRLVIFYRDYRFGKQGTIFDRKWFEHPAQKEIMKRAGLFKLKVEPLPLNPLHRHILVQ